MRPKLSVIICTHNRARGLTKCLTGLAGQTFSNIEIIVVDGGSNDNTSQIVARYAQTLRLTKIVCRSPGLALARDRGWRKAGADLVAWIDDDVIPSPRWAASVIETFKIHPETGGVSGPTLVPPRLLKNRDVFFFYRQSGLGGWLAKFWNNFFLEGGQYQVGKIFKSGAWSPGSNFFSSLKIKGVVEVDYLEACNMSLRKKLVARASGFDLGFAGVGEWSELDLAAKVKKLGYRLVFNPLVLVHHYISQSGVYPRRAHAQQRMENFLKYYFRHVFKFKPDYVFKFLTYLLFLNFYWLYKAIKTKNLNWLGGWWGGLAGLKYFCEKK